MDSALMCISLEMRRDFVGRLSPRNAERRGVANGDVERSRRAISDARYESVAQHVRGYDEQSPH